ncbi:coproporphyrinogen oxidase, partial [Peptoniphilus indolicus ATCC 29427]
MIKIEIENQGLAHEIYEFLRIIFPSYERGNFMCVKIEDELLKINSDEYNFIIPIKKSTNLQRYLKLELINQLKENQLEVPKWGVLHGIRPLKLIYNLLKDRDEEGVRNYLKKEYSVADEKINLAYEILNIQKDIISENIDNYSVYVHIPFCPSKCTYCSYHTLNSKSSMVEDYVNKLIEEIEFESKYLNKNPSSIYIGGGTPTSIGVNNLNNIIEILKDSFGDTKEFTVEAGRVETLTDEMIEMLSNNEVNRISINPQSMNLKTVKSINRINSIEELIECYNKAKPKFKDINMDLIIGLEDETEEDFINSLESVIKLNPTNIT